MACDCCGYKGECTLIMIGVDGYAQYEDEMSTTVAVCSSCRERIVDFMEDLKDGISK